MILAAAPADVGGDLSRRRCSRPGLQTLSAQLAAYLTNSMRALVAARSSYAGGANVQQINAINAPTKRCWAPVDQHLKERTRRLAVR